MLKFLPFILAACYGLVFYLFSAWRVNRDLEQRSTELADADLMAITERFASVVEVDRIRVFLYEVDALNALAAPNGRIYITRGLYNRYRQGDVTKEELAGVIAHELGHVALGHSRRRMIDFSGQNAVRALLASVLGRYIPFVGPWIATMVAGLIMRGLMRSDEFEADAYASALMVSAGIGTEPQKSLFAKLDELTGIQGGGGPVWLMSHPKTRDRIAAIEAREAKWGITQPPK